MEILEREPILQELTQLLSDATNTGGRLVAVCGEAGAARPRWLIVSSAHAWRHLRGMCDSLFTPRPLGPLLDVVHQSAGPLRSAHDANEPRDRLFRAFLEELETACTGDDVIFEDVHWADEATLDLLKFAGRRIAQTRGLLIITYRDDEVTSDHRLHQLLGELPRSTFRRIESAAVSEAAVKRLAERAARPAEGLRGADGRQPVLRHRNSGGGRRRQFPFPFARRFSARAARLSAAARRLLDVVSVVPGRTERWLLESINGQQTAEIAECVSVGMLVPAVSAVAFRHELARRAWESTLEPAAAAALHKRLLDALLEHGVDNVGAARLVHHALQAGAVEEVVRLAPLAAREAAGLGAHSEAVAHFAAALRYENAASASERAELLEAYSVRASPHGRHGVGCASGGSRTFDPCCARRSQTRRRGTALALATRLVAR